MDEVIGKGGVFARMRAFVINHWVSWVIEISILGVVAGFTISEVRKTHEQTRDMLMRYDEAFSSYVAQKSDLVDQAVADSYQSAKEKAQTLTLEEIKKLMDKRESN